MAADRFDEATAQLEKPQLSAAPLAAARTDALQRVRWLAEWKNMLIADINGTGYDSVVTDIHGLRYSGPLRRATQTELELKTRYGTIMSRWSNLSPAMLLRISRAFIRPGAPEAAKREWFSAIFAAQTGQAEQANELAQKAAASKPEFRKLLARFFGKGKR